MWHFQRLSSILKSLISQCGRFLNPQKRSMELKNVGEVDHQSKAIASFKGLLSVIKNKHRLKAWTFFFSGSFTQSLAS